MHTCGTQFTLEKNGNVGDFKIRISSIKNGHVERNNQQLIGFLGNPLPRSPSINHSTLLQGGLLWFPSF